MSVRVEIDAARPDMIAVYSEWRHKELVKALPGSSWDKSDNIWRVPLSWNSCIALRSTFRDDLDIGPALGEWALARRDVIDNLMVLREALDHSGADDLFPFQRAGVEFMALGKQVLLADEMGSGKTVQAIRALAELYNRGENVFPILVVCPNSMKKTWQREFARWWPGIECSIVKGSATQRRKALAAPAHVYIINWESLRSHSRLAPYGSIALARCQGCGGYDERITMARCEVHPRELNDITFGAVIADEAHRSKSPQSKQTRALWAGSGDAPVRFALTGTPIANDVTELWPILHWLDAREWPTKTKWVDRYVDTMLNAFGGLMVLGVKRHMSDEFYAGLHPHMRRMPKALVLPFLPPIVYERRDVEMSAKQRKAYLQMRDELVAELDGEILTVTSPLTKTIRLLQFASSYATMEITGELDEVVKVALAEPSCKIDEFLDDLPDFGDEGVAVMAVSRQLINLLSARLDKKKIPHGLITGEITQDQRQKHIDDFQEGRTKLILFTAAAGGVGITLTAARYLVRLQRPWSRVDDEQALNRVHRIGSERHENIIVVDYVTEHTVEARVLDRLEEKGEYFEDVVKDRDLLRRLLTETES